MRSFWVEFFQGPYQITSADTTPLDKADGPEYVRVTGNQAFDTGVREYTTETQNGVKQQKYVSSTYSVLLVGDKGLVVKGDSPLTVVGELEPLPADLPALIFPNQTDSASRDRLYPMMLDTTDDYRVGGFVMIGVLVLYAWLFWVFGRRAFRQIQDITRHPAVRRIESWADAADVAQMSEREILTAPRYKKSGIVITDQFVLVRTFYSFNLLPFNHLLWAYRKATTRTINFIPLSRTSEAILVFYGGSASFPARKKLVEEVLYFSVNRAPWAFVGHTAELASAYKKDNRGFCAAVEERRERLVRIP